MSFPLLRALAVPLKETVSSAEIYPKGMLTECTVIQTHHSIVCYSKELEVVWMAFHREHKQYIREHNTATNKNEVDLMMLIRRALQDFSLRGGKKGAEQMNSLIPEMQIKKCMLRHTAWPVLYKFLEVEQYTKTFQQCLSLRKKIGSGRDRIFKSWLVIIS